MEQAAENSRPRGVDRRNLLKGAAWGVPVMALATAAPMASASCSGPMSYTANPGKTRTMQTLSITLPKEAKNITFSVMGGGGGIGWGGNREPTIITGTLKLNVAADQMLQLVAGAGGWSLGSDKVGQPVPGYGNGGLGTDFTLDNGATWWVDSGYGGGGSAILLGGNPIVVAGGSGGASSDGGGGPRLVIQGVGGAGGATPQDGSDGSWAGQYARGGKAGTSAAAGAGGGVTLTMTPVGQANGTAGSGRNGGNGGRAVAGGVSVGPHGNGGGGGGGGGYRGGGGGGSFYFSEDEGARTGGGGGAGANFVATTGNVTVVNPVYTTAPPFTNTGYWNPDNRNGIPGRNDGQAGKVTVSWTC